VSILLKTLNPSGSFTLNVGLQYEQAAMVALIRNIDIVVAYGFDMVIFRYSFSAMSLLGGGLVVMATIGSGLFELLHQAGQYKKLRSGSVGEKVDQQLAA
jgi:drug/metabolite transporter (DMT)-like permease